jgi:hypothetical protein
MYLGVGQAPHLPGQLGTSVQAIPISISTKPNRKKYWEWGRRKRRGEGLASLDGLDGDVGTHGAATSSIGLQHPLPTDKSATPPLQPLQPLRCNAHQWLMPVHAREHSHTSRLTSCSHSPLIAPSVDSRVTIGLAKGDSGRRVLDDGRPQALGGEDPE